MRISENFTLEEFERSDKATRLGIDNRVPASKVRNVKALVDEVLQPVRTKLGIPIHISSGYRCPALNGAVKGATRSQHMKGEAADIYITSSKVTLWDVYKCIALCTDFDQLIWETRPSGSKWIHVSYVTYRKNRHQKLQCKDGKTYQTII